MLLFTMNSEPIDFQRAKFIAPDSSSASGGVVEISTFDTNLMLETRNVRN